jgi:hypothetical protein
MGRLDGGMGPEEGHSLSMPAAPVLTKVTVTASGHIKTRSVRKVSGSAIAGATNNGPSRAGQPRTMYVVRYKKNGKAKERAFLMQYKAEEFIKENPKCGCKMSSETRIPGDGKPRAPSAAKSSSAGVPMFRRKR